MLKFYQKGDKWKMELVSEQELFVFIRLDCKKLRKRKSLRICFGLAKAGKLDISVFETIFNSSAGQDDRLYKFQHMKTALFSFRDSDL